MLCALREKREKSLSGFFRRTSESRKTGLDFGSVQHARRMSFPHEKSDKGSVQSEKGEVHEEQADSAANSISSRQKLAHESGIKPIFLAKVNRINEAISECGMGTYVESPRDATETPTECLFTFSQLPMEALHLRVVWILCRQHLAVRSSFHAFPNLWASLRWK